MFVRIKALYQSCLTFPLLKWYKVNRLLSGNGSAVAEDTYF